MRVSVRSSSPLRSLSYVVLGPRDLVLAETLPGEQAEQTTTLHFTATQDMAPTARLLVHALTRDGQLVAGRQDVEMALQVTHAMHVAGASCLPVTAAPAAAPTRTSARPNFGSPPRSRRRHSI